MAETENADSEAKIVDLTFQVLISGKGLNYALVSLTAKWVSGLSLHCSMIVFNEYLTSH